MAALSIDIVSDVVCPWCFIGMRRLEKALESFNGLEVQIRYHPYLLDPTTPPEGRDLREHLQRKYGADPESMFGRVEAAARASGIDLDFSKVRRSVSTLGAHTLLRHAAERDLDVQRLLAKSLFEAYFLEGKDISETTVLCDLAEQVGFTREEATRILGDEEELAETRAEALAAAQGGVTGVPFTVIGQRYAVPGAQEPDAFAKAIARALEDRATSPVSRA
jgi:predicted DsbA family dithiol-disulfide isomerase